ncbi:hypothetical protein RQP46_009088 [Phenoliferia psychrophenolica]
MTSPSFSTIPEELKVKIFKMTSDVDTAWRALVSPEYPDSEAEDSEAEERRSHVYGLSSLAFVNREFRDLAAKHQFERIYSERLAVQPIFLYNILPRYGHHITRVAFVGDNLSHLERQLGTLVAMPSLRTLAFTGKAATALLGPFPSIRLPGTDEEPFFRGDMLEWVSPKITSLFLNWSTPSACVDLIRRFPSLSTLSLSTSIDSDEIDVEDLRSLTTFIANLRHLTHLAIGAIDYSRSKEWPADVLEPLERDPPPIRTLGLQLSPLRASAFDLTGLFGGTLETLAFEIDPTNTTLLTFLAAKPDLIQVCLNERTTDLFGSQAASVKFIPPAKLVAYANLVRSLGLDPTVLDRPHLGPFDDDANLDYTEDEASYLKEVLVRTLKFGIAELERMCAEGRGASAVEWVEPLKPLEKKRWAWRGKA